VNGVPFFAVAGTILEHVELGRLRYVEHLGDWVLHIVLESDPDAGPVRVRLPGSDEWVMPTVPWVLAEFAERRLTDVGNSSDEDNRAGRFLGLDRAACMERDPKSAVRHDWAMAAKKAEMPKSADVLKVWIATTSIPRHPDDTARVKRLKDILPHPRALIRWMGKLEIGDADIWTFVNPSGRMKGVSQLSPVLDRLVHRVALTFLATPRLSSVEDAAALCDRWWRQLEAAGVPDIGIEPPSIETVRLRIRSLDGRTSEEMRDGRHVAKKRFEASGEPVATEHAFERVFMDGTEFRHACLYSDDWQIPSNKMKGVFAMDAHTHYVFPGVVFTGPYRAEMGIQAARNIMVPPVVSAEDVAADPYAGMLVGLPSDLMYDNDKAQLPPALVPATVTATSSTELAPAYLHDAKSTLEIFNKFVKRKLSGVRGQILGPRRMADPRYDPIKAAEVSRAVYAQMVDDARREWNTKPRKRFGNKSPQDLMIEHLLAGGNRLVDPGRIRRHFASTPAERQVLTSDGLVYDKVHYRWNRRGIGEVLDNNHRDTPFDKRIEGSGKVLVTIRVYDGDIDMIEVLDDETGEYHPMWSTNPRYTGGLSRWEHHQYCAMIRAGKGGATSDRDWIALKAQRIVAFDTEMPKADFSARENMAALIEREDIRRKSGRRANDPLFGQLPEIGLVTNLGGVGRADTPEPPPQKIERQPKQQPSAPKRDGDYGFSSTADITRGDPAPADLGDETPDGDDYPGIDAAGGVRREPGLWDDDEGDEA
jgi:putative transposase